MRCSSVLAAVLLIAGMFTPLQAQTGLPTSTTVVVSPSASVPFEQLVTLTATVADGSGNAVLHGTVTFRDGAAILATTSLISSAGAGFIPGTAVFRTHSMAQGSHSLTATFNGTAWDQQSVSGTQSLTITAAAAPYPSATSLISSGNTNGQYTLDATVGGFGPFALTGSVDFTDTTAGSSLQTQTLTPGSFGFLLQSTSPLLTSQCSAQVASGDFNNDGNLDAVVAACDSTNNGLEYYLLGMLGNGQGGFTPATSRTLLGTTSEPTQIVVGDFNGDGNLDIALLVNTSVFVLQGNGDGTFQPPVTVTTANTGSDWVLAAGDFNGNGYGDLAMATLSNDGTGVTLSILPGQANGSFGTPIVTQIDTSQITFEKAGSTIEPTMSIAAGDLNNDGKPDIAIAIGNMVAVVPGNGDGTFQTASLFQDGDQVEAPTGCDPALGCSFVPAQSGTSIALADLSASGNLDIIVGSKGDFSNQGTLGSQVSVLPGNGTGNFPTYATYPLPNYSQSGQTVNPTPLYLDIGDFMYTGLPGVFVATADEVQVGGNSLGADYLLSGKGNGSLQTAQVVNGPLLLDPQVGTGDFANDGNPDLFAAVFQGQWQVPLVLFQPAFLASAELTQVTVPGNGVQRVTASYSGDSDFAASTSNPVFLDTRTPTTLSVVPGRTPDGQQPSAAIVGYTATFVAAVAIPNGGPTPTGTVQFYANSVAIGSPVTLNAGTASFSTTFSATGTYAVTGVYSGDSGYQPETSPEITIDVETQAQPTMAIIGTPATVQNGVPFTATVYVYRSAFGPVPTGNVTLSAPGVDVQGRLSGDPASVSFTLSNNTLPLLIGSGTISATYSGASPWTKSSSAGTSIIVTGTTNLYISYTGSSTVMAGSPLTITGQLTANQLGTQPTGTVTLLDNGTSIASSALNGGSPFALSFTVNTAGAALLSGTHELGLSYGGDANWGKSVSSAVSLTAEPVLSLQSGTQSQSVSPGASAVYTLTVTAEGESESTTFACSDLPAGAACSFNPATVTGSGTTTLTITTRGSQAMADPSAVKLWTSRSGALFACALLLMLPGRRRKFWLLLVLLAFMPVLTVGCGGGSSHMNGGGGNSATPAGTYSITITATAGSGASALTKTSVVTLVVE